MTRYKLSYLCMPVGARRRMRGEPRPSIKLAPPLPTIRPRALTPPLPIEPSQPTPWYQFSKPVERQTLSQSSSLLFIKLPPEIRHAIWTEVLGGGGKLHFVSWRMKAFSCVHRERVNFVALLRTCRIIYSEAIELLYCSIIFDIDHSDVIGYLARSVLPHRLSQIRSLDFYWPNVFSAADWGVWGVDEIRWHQTCRILKTSFTGLKDLKVRVDFTKDHPSIRGKRILHEPAIEPLRELHATHTFEVHVPLSAAECAEASSSRDPFKFLPGNRRYDTDFPHFPEPTPCGCRGRVIERHYPEHRRVITEGELGF